MKYPTSIAAAAKLLDTVLPQWELKINIDTLDMHSGYDCILGQLYNEYPIGLESLGWQSTTKRSDDTIFGRKAVRAEWIAEINCRKQQKQKEEKKTMTFGQAFDLLLEGKKIRAVRWDVCVYLYKDSHSIKQFTAQKTFRELEVYDVLHYAEYDKVWEELTSLRLEDIKAGEQFTLSNSSEVYTRLDHGYKAIDKDFKLKDFSANLEVVRV